MRFARTKVGRLFQLHVVFFASIIICTFADDSDGIRTCENDNLHQSIEEEGLSDILGEDGDLVIVGYECLDLEKRCQEMLEENDDLCRKESEFRDVCKVTCRVCEETDQAKRTTIGVKQTVEGTGRIRHETELVVTEMIRYLREEVLVLPNYEYIYDECLNVNKLCAFWALTGECSENKAFMAGNCTLACKMCHHHEDYVSAI